MILSSPALGADPIGRAVEFPIPAHEAVYEFVRNGKKIGEIHTRLTRDERSIWLYDSRTEATSTLARLLGLAAVESAHFLWRDGDLLALTYHHVAREPFRTRFWQHRMDWVAGQSESRTHDGRSVIALEPSLVDPLTVRLKLAALLHDPENRQRDWSFRVLERDRMEDQSFRFRGIEPAQTLLGCFQAHHYHRFRKAGSSRNYDLWVHPATHWLPVRIRPDPENGDIEINLLSIDWPIAADECD